MTDESDDSYWAAIEELRKALEDPRPAVSFLALLTVLETVAPPVYYQPEVTLEKWSVRRTDFQGRLEDFILGVLVETGKGRKSSPIRAFDPAQRIATTHSGRTYRLEGEPGIDIWCESYWSFAFGKQPFTDVTEIYNAKMRQAAN